MSLAPATVRRALIRPQFWFGLGVLGPLLGWYVVFHWLPMLGALFIALHRFELGNPLASQFVGLTNFADVLRDKQVAVAFQNSIVYAVIYLLGMLPLALVVAGVLNAVVRGRQGYLFCIFLPVVMNVVAVCVLWLWLYDFAAGPLNAGISMLGLPRQKFLNDYLEVLPSVAGVMIWKNLGFTTVILLAGMLNVPTALYDAAKVDGAGAVRQFVHLTLPLLGHTLMLVSVLSVMNGLQIFVPIDVMTGGGPGRSSLVVNLLIYQQGIVNLRLSFASAVALLLAMVVFCITIAQLKLLRPRWSY